MTRLALLALLLLAACAETGTYPLTGAACDPDDPVLDLNAPPCPPS
jgi:hypothetical protein